MKNLVALVLAVLVLGITSVSYAVTREAARINEDETYFGKTGSTGGAQPGNPGYLILQATNWSDSTKTDVYYLWVDVSNRLLIASYAVVSPFASYPSGDWRKPNFPVGTVVGGQS